MLLKHPLNWLLALGAIVAAHASFGQLEIFKTYDEYQSGKPSETYPHHEYVNSNYDKTTPTILFKAPSSKDKLDISLSEIWGLRYHGETFRVMKVEKYWEGTPVLVKLYQQKDNLVLWENGAYMPRLKYDANHKSGGAPAMVSVDQVISGFLSVGLNGDAVMLTSLKCTEAETDRIEQFYQDYPDAIWSKQCALKVEKRYNYWQFRNCFE